MPGISTLYAALSGLAAHQRRLDVTGHNVANQATPGYHRQRVELQPVASPATFNASAASMSAGGVQVKAVVRSADELLALRALRESAAARSTEVASVTYSRLEGVFPDVGGEGISTRLAALWDAFTVVANDPGDLAARTQLLAQADAAATALNAAAATLGTVRDAAIARYSSIATQVNGLATEVARLNVSIGSSPEASADLVDRRGVVVGELSRLVGAVPRTLADGTFEVVVAGRTLVSGGEHYAVAAGGGSLVWAADTASLRAASGEAAALAAVIDDVVPRHLARLDDVAATLVSQVNALHTAGVDQSGGPGVAFFDLSGTTAATVRLSADVAGQPSRIAAGRPPSGGGSPGALDGENARALGRLAAAAGGADDRYQALVASLGVESQTARQTADIQAVVADAASADAASVSSVSIDEEMTELVSAQRAYQACARVITAVDEMLGVLIERTGVVGR